METANTLTLGGVTVLLWESEIDGRIVVQVDTTDELGEDENGEPKCRIYLNDWLAHGVKAPTDMPLRGVEHPHDHGDYSDAN